MAGEFRQGFERRSGGFAGPPLLFGLDSQGLYHCPFKRSGSGDELFAKIPSILSVYVLTVFKDLSWLGVVTDEIHIVIFEIREPPA